MGDEAANAYIAQIDQPGTRMARIDVQPIRVDVLDFQTRFASALGGSRVLPHRDRLAEVKEVAGVVRPLDVDEARVVVAVVRTAPALQVGIREAGVDG